MYYPENVFFTPSNTLCIRILFDNFVFVQSKSLKERIGFEFQDEMTEKHFWISKVSKCLENFAIHHLEIENILGLVQSLISD